MPRVACVFAHPDDETYAAAGTLHQLTARGGHCSLFCATNGDAGRSSGVVVTSRAALGALRRKELLAAAHLLGIAETEFGGHPDGALPELDGDALVGEIVHFLRRSRAHVVITFGPEGALTGHRDHRAISRAATAAFFLAGVPTEYPEQRVGGLGPYRPARLYYAAWPNDGAAGPARDSLRATARIDIVAARDVKLAAFMLHVTQRDHLADFTSTVLTDAEYFALAAGHPQPEPMVDDLFAGL